jgi:corrinoid protein of di/trimethylamine methyltransferase
MSKEELLKAMAKAIEDGDPSEAEVLARQALAEGLEPLEAINQGLVPGITVVGNRYSCGEAFLPDLVLGGEAMKAALKVLEPELEKRGGRREVLGKVVLGTVQGDIHEIGKTLVGTMLSANGFAVFDLGVDVPTSKFVEKVREVGANLVGLSALLTTTMSVQRYVIEALEESGIRKQVKVMVGGAPVTQSWADEIGADGYSEDAAGAIVVAKRLVGAS